jgi:hypothetical protein
MGRSSGVFSKVFPYTKEEKKKKKSEIIAYKLETFAWG